MDPQQLKVMLPDFLASWEGQLPLVLKPGQMLWARVLNMEGNKALLGLANGRLEVEMRAPLETGATIYLQVKELTPQGQLHLQVLPGNQAGGPTAEQALSLTPGLGPEYNLLIGELKRAGYQEQAASLEALQARLVLEQDEPPRELARKLEGLPGHLEELKPFLQRLSKLLGESRQGEGAALADRLTDRLTNLQLLNLSRQMEGWSLALSGLVQVGGGEAPFFFKITGEKEDGGSKGGMFEPQVFQALLFLQVPRLGRVTARLRMAAGGITVGLAVDSAAAQNLINSRLGELDEELALIFGQVSLAPCAYKTSREFLENWGREAGAAWPPATLDIRV